MHVLKSTFIIVFTQVLVTGMYSIYIGLLHYGNTIVLLIFNSPVVGWPRNLMPLVTVISMSICIMYILGRACCNPHVLQW